MKKTNCGITILWSTTQQKKGTKSKYNNTDGAQKLCRKDFQNSQKYKQISNSLRRENNLQKGIRKLFTMTEIFFYYGGGYTTAYNYQIYQTEHLELENILIKLKMIR